MSSYGLNKQTNGQTDGLTDRLCIIDRESLDARGTVTNKTI